ncbi:hypothetical protein HELRODRAFT_164944 [Helobdella robusta]|uniref:Uncharacterized protein n=1 Tax=Helobdella robusta TaxID=6412 RepID=T1EW00_HELRO|nr:hypothetical protein HELRODRAFT_164944 [Helobdella robusta]ESN92820.1 hypothetical protein HELRODRAFT_164944 [Helobdella robusta]
MASKVTNITTSKAIQAKHYSIIADCTPDISHKEQLECLKFVVKSAKRNRLRRSKSRVIINVQTNQTKLKQFQEKEPFKINLNLMNINKIEERQPPEESNKIKVVLSKNKDENDIQQSQQQNAEQNVTIPSANLHMNDSLLPVLSLPSPVQQQQQQDHHRKRKAEHSSSSSHTSHSRNRLQLDRRLHERPEQNLNQQQKRQPRFQQQRHHQHLMKQDKCQPNYQRQKQHHYEKQAQQQHKKQDRRQPNPNQQPNTPEKGGE